MEPTAEVSIRSREVEYVRFYPDGINASLLSEIILCYQRVFEVYPWNEWKKCRACGTHWGISERKIIDGLGGVHCGLPIEEYHPAGKIIESIKKSVSDDASCWIAVQFGGKVVGFTWGRPITAAQLAARLEITKITEKMRAEFGGRTHIAFQHELGVLPEHQGRKIGKKLAALRLADFKARGLETAMFTTQRTPPSVTYLWFSKDGYRVVFESGGSTDRVLLARDITNYEIQVDM
ncbi:MAG: hypothetical protein JWN50_644 [Parcubacteria group bacterium]|nr:hypothetical protein [Parcubacteria group bacterium]